MEESSSWGCYKKAEADINSHYHHLLILKHQISSSTWVPSVGSCVLYFISMIFLWLRIFMKKIMFSDELVVFMNNVHHVIVYSSMMLHNWLQLNWWTWSIVFCEMEYWHHNFVLSMLLVEKIVPPINTKNILMSFLSVW